MIYSIYDIIINFFVFLSSNIIFFLLAEENRSFIIEVIKIIYYLVLIIITKHYSEINNKVKLLESSNQSFYKLFQFFNSNIIDNTIILKKDTDDKLIKIYENKLYDFFFNNEILEDISLRKLIKSLEKIKEIRKINLDNNDEKSKNKNYQSKFKRMLLNLIKSLK